MKCRNSGKKCTQWTEAENILITNTEIQRFKFCALLFLVLSVTQLWKLVQVIFAQIFKWHLGTSINTYLKLGASPLSTLCPWNGCTAWWPRGKRLTDCKQPWNLIEIGTMYDHIIVPQSFGDASLLRLCWLTKALLNWGKRTNAWYIQKEDTLLIAVEEINLVRESL